MDVFMTTYEENLKKEQEKIEQLEKDIVFALEHSSSNIDLDLSEIDSLKQKDGYSATYDESKHSIESLMKDYERFQSNLKKARTEKYLIFFIYNLKKKHVNCVPDVLQVEATRERLATELQTLPEKTKIMKEELITLTDLEKLRDEGRLKANSLYKIYLI